MIYRMKLADSVDEMTFDLLEVPIEDKDIEGATDNTTIDGNIFTDYLWLKKQFVQKWSLMCKDDYTQLRGFYTRQWENAEAPTYTLFAGQNRSETLTASGSAFQIQNGTQYDAPLTLTELKGNAEQTTYSGKNLLQITNTSATTTNGITFTPNSDGSIKISGTATATAWFIMNNTLILPAGTYTYSSHNSTLSSGTAVLYNDAFGYTTESKTRTLTSASTGDWAIRVASGTTINTTVYPMVEIGSTMTDFEPFVGSTPTSITASPNPAYPQPISTTTGENVVKITGKNLANVVSENEITYSGYGNFTLADGVITTSGNTLTGFKVRVQPNTRYTVQVYTTGTGGTKRIRIREYTSEPSNWSDNYIGQSVDKQASADMATSESFTTGATTNWVLVCVYCDVSGISFSNIQLELGSATTYEPYQGQEYGVNLGKNLFDKNNYSSTAGYFYSSDTLIGTGSPAHNVLFWIPCASNTKYSITIPTGYGIITKVATSSAVPANGVSITGSYRTEATVVNGYTTSATAKYLVIYLQAPNYTIADILDDIVSQLQIEVGSQATSYSAYFTPIELAKIGNYQDRIYKQDGKWYVEKQIGKVVLDGSENWYHPTSSGGYFQLDNSFGSLPFDANPATNALCDHFICRPRWHVATSTAYNLSINMNAPLTAIRYGAITDLADFKTWLASNPTTVYYALATPTTTEITNQTLIDQLNFIANLYGGTNNIMLVGTGAQGEIGVEYTLTYEKEQTIIPETTVRLTLTDGGVINTCECRQNVQLTMRETVQ